MDQEIVVDVLPIDLPEDRAAEWEDLAEGLRQDAVALLMEAIFPPPSPTLFVEIGEDGEELAEYYQSAAELSVGLVSDDYIAGLNERYRGYAEPTDVLSFPQTSPLGDEDESLLLGDVVISVETAQRQADERGYSLRDELRVLLVHGVLHLLGHDHEEGAGEGMAEAMALEERRLMKVLGWQGEGLVIGSGLVEPPDEATVAAAAAAVSVERAAAVAAAAAAAQEAGNGDKAAATVAATTAKADNVNKKPADAAVATVAAMEGAQQQRVVEDDEEIVEPPVLLLNGARPWGTSRPQALVLDMDGTLLNSQSKISPKTAEVLRQVVAEGLRVIIATGKARPAAIAALHPAGLDQGVACATSPGVFLQGLKVYGSGGELLVSRRLEASVCRDAFAFAAEHRMALIGFSGDQCVAVAPHQFVDELHERYYEPRAVIVPAVDELLDRFPLNKLLFYDYPDRIASLVRPHWAQAVGDRASITQAVSNMLEILPHGASKGGGLRILLDHLGLDAGQVMAVGDGENDVEMLELVGLGVAMGNAAPRTLDVADAVVASNDEDGVAEAVERFIFSS